MIENTERELGNLLERSRNLSWKVFGKNITLYLPGMIRCGSETGLYPAVSVSGGRCELACDHCAGKVLEPMIEANNPDTLFDVCKRIKKAGNIGVLLSGGSRYDGKVGWDKFADIIKRIKDETGLHISIHTGLLNSEEARLLKSAGVDQALTDVIGSDETLKEVYHLECGVGAIKETLDALYDANIPAIPHIVAGLHYGKFRGEYNALDMLEQYSPETLVIVTLTPFAGTPMEGCKTPHIREVANLICNARITLAKTEISLGCEHPRNRDGIELEKYAVLAGVNRIAVYSNEAEEVAEKLGIDIHYAKTCCSVRVN